MKITGTRSYMDVEYNGKTARFKGELTLNGFYAIKESIHWQPPFDTVAVSKEEKNEIINAVLKESEKKEFKIYFEE